jgi:hypothetical protein
MWKRVAYVSFIFCCHTKCHKWVSELAIENDKRFVFELVEDLQIVA